MFSNKPFLLLTLVLVLNHFNLWSQIKQDSVSPIAKINDSIIVDSTVVKQPLLLDRVRYTAIDTIKLIKKQHKLVLYNKAELYYQDTELKAGIIILDYQAGEVYAGRIRNSQGELEQLPEFKQGENIILPDSIRFNFNTQKALIWNSRSDQGGLGGENMNLLADYTKKENDSVFFLKDIRLTSSQTPEDPDYYIRIKKAKFVPKKKMIAGFSNLYLMDIPTPIALPFAYFPMTQGRAAGMIMPSFGSDPNRGYFLQNAGYYLPINQYADLYLTADLYANGSWGFRSQSVYNKRYKFNGSFNLRFENLVTSQKGFDDYSKTSIYNIQFSHSQASKANPTSRFSASVNLGSSSYFRNSLNRMNLPNTQNNNLSSSINYSKTFPEYPRVDLSLTASHNQNTNTQEINLTLPTLQASMERIYPFAKREGIKKGLLQNFNIQYSVRSENRITTTDSLFFKPEMFKAAKLGVQHSIPFNTNFKLAKYLSVSVGGSFTDNWVTQTYGRSMVEGNVVKDTVRGFDRFSKYNFNINMGTTVYGTFNFKEGKKIQAIRHTLRPSVNIGYTPGFDQYYDQLLDGDGNIVEYSRFTGSYYSPPSRIAQKSMGISIQNSFEAKINKRVKKRIDNKDTIVTELKKVKLIPNLSFSTSYNLDADSLKINPIRFSGNTKLLKDLISLNFNGTLDPYEIDPISNNRINTFVIQNGGGLVRLTQASANINFSLDNNSFKKKSNEEEENTTDQEQESDYFMNTVSGGRSDNLFGRPGQDPLNQARTSSENRKLQSAYTNKIGWRMNFSYALSYRNLYRDPSFSNNTLMFSGDIDLTPKWSVGVSSGYDIKNKGFTLTQFRIDRELKDFRLNFDWTPFGVYERWYFFIGIKSALLSDLKWDKRSRRF